MEGRLRLPANLVKPNGILKAAERVLAAVREEEPLPRAQPSYDVGGKDLAALGVRCDARRHDHGRAKQVATLFDRLARIEPDANVYRLLIRIGARSVVQLLERSLQSDRTLDRAGRRRERGHEPVPHRLNLRAPVSA